MMKSAALALGLSLACAGACAAAEVDAFATSPTGRSVELSWAAQPSGRDLIQAYPPRALARGIQGETRLMCRIWPNGRLYGCYVVSETPPGFGFAGAALSLVPRFQARLLPGRPIPRDMRVTVGIHWVLGSHAHLPRWSQ
jgi:protein TonB